MSSSLSRGVLSYELLKQQNAETSNAILAHYVSCDLFETLAKNEGDVIMQRDAEDSDKLQAGIDFAKSKGVIDPNFVPEPYIEIDVLGKTPQDVSRLILHHVQQDNNQNKDKDEGIVIVLCGLSGTGKGTTVSKLCQELESRSKKQSVVVCWSNGNVFRSVTLLATTWCEQQHQDIEAALSKKNLANFMSMLHFGPTTTNTDGGKEYDIQIKGLGLDHAVSQIQNTLLKEPRISKNIPTVAQASQGEVILYAARSIDTLKRNGITVLLEGRKQTVDYVRSNFRFTLILSDETLIGRRRAAQRIMAGALHSLEEKGERESEEEIPQILDEQLRTLILEMKDP